LNNLRILPKLMVFATVAQKGSFTQAAAELGITKSAVSQSVSLLEDELGQRVLNRTTRGMSLTPLGEKLFLRCRLLQDQVDLTMADITDAKDNPSGRFAVTCPHALETTVAIPAINQLCIEYPRLEPELIVDDKPLDMIENNLDMAIHIGELPDSSNRALPVGMITEVFCATPLYLHRTFTPRQADDLSKCRWIATAWQREKTRILDLGKDTGTTVTLSRFAKANTLPSALEMALNHMGMVLLPDAFAGPFLNSGDLVRILPEVTGPRWPIYSIHPYQKDKPVHVRRFQQLVKLYFETIS
jgi:DNA-binding transcriptional LysR family regulator